MGWTLPSKTLHATTSFEKLLTGPASYWDPNANNNAPGRGLPTVGFVRVTYGERGRAVRTAYGTEIA
jgi:hypothetical protein